MVLAAWLEEKLERSRAAHRAERIAQGHAEGFAQGFAESRAEGFAQGFAEGFAQGFAEGRAEGFAQANRDWEDWNRRREAALARDEAFSEPTPSRRRGGGSRTRAPRAGA